MHSNSLHYLSQTGVQIFSRRPPQRSQTETQDVLALLEKYPRALLLHLEFLVHDLDSEVGERKKKKAATAADAAAA